MKGPTVCTEDLERLRCFQFWIRLQWKTLKKDLIALCLVWFGLEIRIFAVDRIGAQKNRKRVTPVSLSPSYWIRLDFGT